MKKLIAIPVILLLAAGFLAQIGCNGGDDPSTPTPAGCSINVTAPLANAAYQSGDEVKIRWEKTGDADSVAIDLLQGGTFVANIDSTLNDGYKSWSASTLGAVSSSDFSVRVTALGETGCGDTSADFSILNTAGCALSFTINFDPDANPVTPLVLNAGQDFEITWDSENTAGSVEILLMRGDLPDDEPVGYLTTNTPDDGSFMWSVDSLHQGTYSFYYLRINALAVNGCTVDSPFFTMVDEDVCEIWVTQPQPGAVWAAGQTHTVSFTAVDPATTHVNINLYQGLQYALTIANNVPVTAASQSQDVTWLVDLTGYTPQGSTYRVKVSDAHDPYCVGWSSNFTITP